MDALGTIPLTRVRWGHGPSLSWATTSSFPPAPPAPVAISLPCIFSSTRILLKSPSGLFGDLYRDDELLPSDGGPRAF